MSAVTQLFTDERSRDVLLQWWQNLQQNTGDRALLRRASQPLEVVFVPAYHELYHSLLDITPELRRDALALVAGLVSHVRQHHSELSLAKQFASPKANGEPRLSKLRFLTLAGITELTALYLPMLRVIHLLDNQIDIPHLAHDCYFFGDKVRKNWAYDYFANVV